MKIYEKLITLYFKCLQKLFLCYNNILLKEFIMKIKIKVPKERNFVAKYDCLINKAKTFKDRKKALKKGYAKHKKAIFDGFSKWFKK